jgi:signal transduction histidine kinase
VDEYQLEIQSIRTTLTRLRTDEADPELIEEYEAELRILVALYTAAIEVLEAGVRDARLRTVLAELDFGEWTMENVYSFVYEAALDMDEAGHDLAARVGQTDFADALLAAE